jgi:hypothetical protein
MVIYSFDCNYVKPVRFKSNSATGWLKAFGGIFQELTSCVFNPKLQTTMYNEESSELQSYFTENIMTYQLVPSHCHRRNADEHVIRTFKENFVAGLSSEDPDFPMHILYCLLPKAEKTLNLLLTSRLHQQLSAAAHFHGLIDYNKTAFSPPGCKSIAHWKPSYRRTLAPHGHPVLGVEPGTALKRVPRSWQIQWVIREKPMRVRRATA